MLTDKQKLEILHEALQDVETILWMAKEYADAGGRYGPENRDYERVEEKVKFALRVMREEENV